jgi:hypothetical protein
VSQHNPRGSNDRNCERNVNRNNGNRLFDSQNNAKGGYACPRAVGDETVDIRLLSSKHHDGITKCILNYNQVQNEDGIAQVAQFKQDKKIYFYEVSVLKQFRAGFAPPTHHLVLHNL